MAASTGRLLLFFAIYLAKNAQAADNFGIVEPYPKHIYPMEGTSAQVTCVAFDSSGVQTPDRIMFMRKDNYALYTNITATDNLYFTSETKEIDQDGKKLKTIFVTLHIRNTTLSDDSQYGPLGRYECHAFAVGSSTAKKHGFSVSVIRKTEIPHLSVPKAGVLQHDDDITIACNVTKAKDQMFGTLLKRISWYKDGVLKESVKNPDLDTPKDTLGPLKISKIAVKDGGNYTCVLQMLLRGVKLHNVSDSTMIRIAPWFDKPKDGLLEGNTVSFECAIKGFPLQVEWKFQKRDEDTVRSCINGLDGKYFVERSGIYAPYVLTVSDIQNTDFGFYYCCLPSNCSDNVKDNCQRFVLQSAVRSQSTQCHIQDVHLLATLILSVMSTIARNEL